MRTLARKNTVHAGIVAHNEFKLGERWYTFDARNNTPQRFNVWAEEVIPA